MVDLKEKTGPELSELLRRWKNARDEAQNEVDDAELHLDYCVEKRRTANGKIGLIETEIAARQKK